MKGTFNITCVRKPDGSTAIGAQNVTAPFHLSKPYWDGQVLLIQNVNMTAGVFSGDELSLRVKVASGASALLTSPSASRIHTMPDGEASLVQEIEVADNAWLEWMPELFIPQRQCTYKQLTTINVARGGSLFAVETLAPGRVAHGEAFEFSQVTWSTRLYYDDRLVLAERYPLRPSDTSLCDLRANGAAKYFASAMLIHESVPPIRTLQEGIEPLNSDEVSIGATSLESNVVLFRILAGSSIALKHTLLHLRYLLARDIPLLESTARKL